MKGLKLSMQMQLRQGLVMTPQLQQTIKFLQMSQLELQQEIEEALESNMMLVLDEDGGHEANGQTASLNGSESTEQSGNETPEQPPLITEHSDDRNDAVDIIWDDGYIEHSAQSSSSAPSSLDPIESRVAEKETLQSALEWQINLTPMSEGEREIARMIVDALNDDGYLARPLADIVSNAHREIIEDEDEIESVLHLVQSMDPPGIAARDLRECLLIQLRLLPPETAQRKKAMQLVSEHLELLAQHDYTQISRLLGIKNASLDKTLALIQALNPRPGRQPQEAAVPYVEPDVLVKKVRGVWQVELNSEALPKISINKNYAQMVRRADASEKNVRLKTHLQEAKWLIKSLQSRGETLLRVASAIVETQQPFLEHGSEAMRPLTLRVIAEKLGLHESTISRVTDNKCLQTPRGVFEAKYFFSSQINAHGGGSFSSTAIRAMIKKLIDQESAKKPLSDNKIVAYLAKEFGVDIARRTVAKYREEMGILSSSKRKHIT